MQATQGVGVISSGHQGTASLAACVAHVLGWDPSEVLEDEGKALGQWLAGRGLGLVPVATPGASSGLAVF